MTPLREREFFFFFFDDGVFGERSRPREEEEASGVPKKRKRLFPLFVFALALACMRATATGCPLSLARFFSGRARQQAELENISGEGGCSLSLSENFGREKKSFEFVFSWLSPPLFSFCSLAAQSLSSSLTDLVVPAVEHVAQLHHDGVAAAPGRARALVLREHARELERRDRLAEVAVDVADWFEEGEFWFFVSREGCVVRG